MTRPGEIPTESMALYDPDRKGIFIPLAQLPPGRVRVGDRYTVRAGRQEFFTLTLTRDAQGEFIVDRQGLLIRRTRRVDLYLGGIFDQFVFEFPEEQPQILKVRPLDIVAQGSPFKG